MSDEHGLQATPDDAALSWAMICQELPDLQRWAYSRGLSSRFRDLKTVGGTTAGSLEAWLSMRKELLEQETYEQQHAKEEGIGPLLAALDDVVGPGFADDDQMEYACPRRLCARRALSEFGEAPICDLLGQNMRQATGDGSRHNP